MAKATEILEFSIYPIVDLRSGELAALSLASDGGKSGPIELSRLWFATVRGVGMDLAEMGFTGTRPLIVAATTDELLDEKCRHELEQPWSERIVVHWSSGTGDAAKIREAAGVLQRLRTNLGCEISVSVGGAKSAVQRLLRPEWIRVRSAFVERATRGAADYVMFLEVIEEYRDRGARAAVDWIENPVGRRVAMSGGIDYGIGWAWPRKAGFLTSLKGRVNTRDWLAELAEGSG